MQEDWQRSLANYQRLMTKVKVLLLSLSLLWIHTASHRPEGESTVKASESGSAGLPSGHHEEGPFRIYIKSAS